jgi:hypothetical protein
MNSGDLTQGEQAHLNEDSDGKVWDHANHTPRVDRDDHGLVLLAADAAAAMAGGRRSGARISRLHHRPRS